MGYYIFKEPTAKSIILFAEIKDRYYADVDKWHFVRCDEFETKEQCQKSLENGSYLVRNVFTEQEYNNRTVAE